VGRFAVADFIWPCLVVECRWMWCRDRGGGRGVGVVMRDPEVGPCGVGGVIAVEVRE